MRVVDRGAMPTGARPLTALAPRTRLLTSATPGPLPFEQLLRSDGSRGPLDVVTARALVAADAVAVLAVVGRGRGPAAWHRSGFARRVEAARRHLAPIAAADVLAESFRREAFLTALPRRGPDAVRAAYAIRWLELVAGVAVPPWHAWMSVAPPA